MSAYLRSRAKLDQAWARLTDQMKPERTLNLARAIKGYYRMARKRGAKLDEFICTLALLALGEASLMAERRQELESEG